MSTSAMFRGTLHAAAYRAYRPRYPQKAIDLIMNFAKTRASQATRDNFNNFAVDTGCGSGQFTTCLNPHYKHVLGIDESDQQIEQASKHNTFTNVKFEVADAKEIPVENKSVDLITAAQAIHWFDRESFFPEVRRVLKPKSGCMAFIMHSRPFIHFPKENWKSFALTRLSDEMYEFYRDQSFMDERARRAVYDWDNYSIPFQNVVRDKSIIMEKLCSVDEYLGYVCSMSSYQNYLQVNPEGPLLKRLQSDILKILTPTSKEDVDDIRFVLKFPLDIMLASV